MVKIEEKAENFIKANANGYAPIHFYELPICYLSFSDYQAYESCMNKLNKDQPKILYEICQVYFSQFF